MADSGHEEEFLDKENQVRFGELESLLASFSPKPSTHSTAQLMYLAGQESARLGLRRDSRRIWLWPASTIALSAVTLLLSFLLWNRHESGVRRIDKFVEQPSDETRQDKEFIVSNNDQSHESILDGTRHVEHPNVGTATYRSPMLQASNYLQARGIALENVVESSSIMPLNGGGLGEPPRSLHELREEFLPKLVTPTVENAGRTFDWRRFFNHGENL